MVFHKQRKCIIIRQKSFRDWGTEFRDNKTNNELIMLGTGNLILGVVLGSYSLSTYVETKDLASKIDF